MTLASCNSTTNNTFVSQAPKAIRELLDAGGTLNLTVNILASSNNGTCNYEITVGHPNGTWSCYDLADKLLPVNNPAAKLRAAIGANAIGALSSTPATVAANNVDPISEPDSPIPFSPYVIIIPAVIVVVLFGVCLWMWCARPKIKRQERPVFDGFEMGDAQQLESSSNLEFAVPEVEFEDPRGGSKHRLTIN